MKNNDLVDMPRLIARLQREGSSVFGYWCETACEIEPGAESRIRMVAHNYKTFGAAELKDFRYKTFVEEILGALGSVENKKSLLQAEALQEKKF